jgi:hypothetical protein
MPDTRALICPECGWLFWRRWSAKKVTPQHRSPSFWIGTELEDCPGTGKVALEALP